MAEGLATATCTSILDAIGNAVSFSFANVWMKLHTGAPGSAGTTNAATETTRKQCSFAAASSASMASDADLTWTSVAGTETYTKCSFWSASSAGTFLFSGTVTANAVTAGDTFTIASGSLTLTLTAAS